MRAVVTPRHVMFQYFACQVSSTYIRIQPPTSPHKLKQVDISSNYQLRKEQTTSSQLNISHLPFFPTIMEELHLGSEPQFGNFQ